MIYLKELKENSAQGTNVPNNQTELTENSAQDEMIYAV